MGETELSIIEAAKKIFVQKGFAAARMQEIADKAGINKALLHYYFRSKDKLYRVIVSETIGMIIPRLAKAIEFEGTVEEKIDQIIETYIDTITENPHMPTFMMTELAQSRPGFVEEVKKNAMHLPNFQDFFMKVMKEGNEGKISKVNPIHLLINILALCIFPFLIRPIFTTVVEVPNEQFDLILRERKEEVKNFIRSSLRP
ncbi:MAG: helix-turn-helix domain-containing protein [Bacteroidota bacterium]